MKKFLIHFILAGALAACSNPVLKWIDIPAAGNEDPSGRSSGPGGGKEITAFSFGIDGETDLPIGSEHDISGKIPIAIILPEGTGPGALAPRVEFIGKSLAPPSGAPRNFSSPVDYTVTAEDGSTAVYLVTVYVKGPSSKEIAGFAIDVSPSGSSNVRVEGRIDQGGGDQAKGAITVTVPAGTGLSRLTAHVTHTGVLTLGPLGAPHSTETFDFTGDFSAETRWTVVARDDSTKEYTVTVEREKSHDKAITSFRLGVAGEEDLIGGEPQPDGKYPILALVPKNAALDNKAPLIDYVGASISPAPETSLDFSTPKTYTVTAEDGSVREYTVYIVEKNGVDGADKIITGFYFQEPLVRGVIDQVKHTIALTVPAGTDLGALRPEIYYKGASVSPISGQPRDFTGAAADPAAPVLYTVRDQEGGSQNYEVSVFIAPSPPVVDASGAESGKATQSAVAPDFDRDSGNYPVIVEFPAHIENPAYIGNLTYIENPVLTITYPAASADDNETLNQILNQLILLQNKEVYSHITNETINNYIANSNAANNTNYTQISNDVKVDVSVINPPPDNPANPPVNAAPSIDGFYFTSPPAVGEIDQASGTISVTVPSGTDPRNLTAGICYTGKEIAGIPGSNPLKHTTSFNGPVSYTVRGEDGKTTKTYEVTVTVAKNTANEITALSFDGTDPANVSISAMPNADGDYPVDITVAPDASFDSLKPVISFNGASISGDGFTGTVTGPGPAEAASAVSFIDANNNPKAVKYTVTSENGETKTYAVTVHTESNDDIPEITGFYFTSPLAAGVVNQDTNAISVTVPSGANIQALAPALYFNGASVQPASGQVKDFSGPVVYTVTGTTGKTRSYTVTVTPTPSSSKDITRFTIPGVPNSEAVIGAVPDPDGTYPVAVWVPAGLPLDTIAPVITHTGASITPSPGTPLNFNGGSQTYTVTAGDGTTKTFKVTVSPRDDDAKIMTSFIFNEVPVSEGTPVRAVGSIDQDAHTVTVTVPATADASGLVPTITYIGKSISEPGGSNRTSNPFTGAKQNFGSSQTYAVKDQTGGEQGYAVTVIKQSPVTVAFTGEVENDVIKENTFDQKKGVVAVEIDTDKVSPPYGWYVNGVKQAVPDNQAAFSLNVGDGSFTPGRHEIIVSGKKSGLHYTAKVYFEVSR